MNRSSGPDYTRLADKYLVRDYVARKIGAEYLITNIGRAPIRPRFRSINGLTSM